MNSLCGAYLYALLAQTALVEVDIRHVVLHRDGLELALLHTLAASDTGCLTCLHGYGTLVLVDA